MGSRMAPRLIAAGYRLRVFDMAADARDRFAASHPSALVCDSGAEAVSGAAVVVTMLPDGGSVRDFLLGSGGAVAGRLEGDAIVVDMSSSSPIDTQETGRALTERGIGMIDAPVSGGVLRAETGTLAILAGGDRGLVHRCTSLLQAMGSSVFLTGPLGSGHAMKALNNYVSAAGLVAACEALIVGRRFGLDPGLMVDVLNASTGKNNSTENKLKQHVLSDTYASGFALGLMAKDLRTAAGLAEHAALPVPLMAACEHLWHDASRTLAASADHTEIFRYLRDLGRHGG
jgi:3-hydroxyisobutyrate dehydrogenase